MSYNIAVLGSHKKDLDRKIYQIAEDLGKHIASNGHTLITGAATGISYHAAKGAKSRRGLTIGFSPFENAKQKISSISYDYLDKIIYTGLGFKGRNVQTVNSAQGIITVNGGFGTLNEITIAQGLGNPIVSIKGSGGTSDIIREVFRNLDPSYKLFRETSNVKQAVLDIEELIK